jgi:Ca2+/Na+ antiporter
MFKGSKGAYIGLVITISVICFLWLNYVRRSYFVRPIFKLRRKLGINGNIAEALLIPMAYGVVPLIVRLQGAHKNMDFGFNLGASLGSMFTLSAFVVGVCAVVLKVSKPANVAKVSINLLFILIAVSLMLILGLKKEVDLIDGLVFIGAWFVYLAFLYLNGQGDGKILSKRCLEFIAIYLMEIQGAF